VAVSVEGFKARFREFEKATDTMVSKALSEAARNVDADVFGDSTDDAVEWQAAHLLALSPWGRSAKLDAKDGGSRYLTRFLALARSHTPGFRVC